MRGVLGRRGRDFVAQYLVDHIFVYRCGQNLPYKSNYHAVPTNSRALVAFRTEIAKSWHRVLIRRGELTSLNWTRMNRLIDEWLPKPRILHPWPDKRFAVTHPR